MLFGTMMASQAGAGVLNAVGSFYGTKAQGYNQMARRTAETIPLYQQIGAKIREQMNQQGSAYLQSGVDVSQGTAMYVIEHKNQQGIEKINEIASNLETEMYNMKKMSNTQAKINLIDGIVNTAQQVGGTMFNKYLYDNMNNPANGKTTLFETSKATSEPQSRHKYVIKNDNGVGYKYEGNWISGKYSGAGKATKVSSGR